MIKRQVSGPRARTHLMTFSNLKKLNQMHNISKERPTRNLEGTNTHFYVYSVVKKQCISCVDHDDKIRDLAATFYAPHVSHSVNVLPFSRKKRGPPTLLNLHAVKRDF